MQFTTPIAIAKSNHLINYNSKIVSLGSCFAENMAKKFEYFKFQNTVNPFGIIFNAVAIEKLIFRSIHKHYFTEAAIFFHNQSWHCYEVHSELSNPNKEEFLKTLNELIDSTHVQITQATHFIITLGTAWVYRDIGTNEIVANCHKVPQKQFTKELLPIETINKSLQKIVTLITEINKEAKFIFTVSPVRHIKDGFAENTLSKSHLISAIHKVANCQLSIINYFPSFEIMIDELRDYRFYTEDMLHPNQTAINYIWIRFFENYIDSKEFATMQQVCDIQKGLHHKPFHSQSDSHQQFLSKLRDKITKLVVIYPFMKF
ncbi:GSCFA domain-containing protein [Flavobacterium psychrophilum]|nr:GSCFA domain-containing protein [Flavobacterium psychrophilum]